MTTRTARPLPLVLRLLVEEESLDPGEARRRARTSTYSDRHAERQLIESGVVDEWGVARLYARHWMVDLHDPATRVLDEDLGALRGAVSEQLCRSKCLAAVRQDNSGVDFLVAGPESLEALKELKLRPGQVARPRVAARSAIDGLLDQIYGERGATDLALASKEAESDFVVRGNSSRTLDLDRRPESAYEAAAIRAAQNVLRQALTVRASDIHFERFEGRIGIRLRIDGKLVPIEAPDPERFQAVVARLKVLARMDISETRLPQDGSFTLLHDGRSIDVRASTLPTVNGEKMVLRLLDRLGLPTSLEQIGLDQSQVAHIENTLALSHGLLLLTGPTGSGKSTTLSACLRILNNSERNITTVEDPVEYALDGVNQAEVRAGIGLEFAAVLRAVLRQDPDVIMVGEIRDAETAETTIRAALTGHLVLSTVHANDSLAAVERLRDLGVESFLVAETLRLTGAQRLVRRLCTACRQPTVAAEGLFEVGSTSTIYSAVGCRACFQTGYRGRAGIFEFAAVDVELSAAISRRETVENLRQIARQRGMTPLAERALAIVRSGVTSLDEVRTILLDARSTGLVSSMSHRPPADAVLSGAGP